MKIINSVSRVLGYVATGLLVPMMLLIVADVFLRFAFDRPIIGTPEITQLLMVCLALGVAWCGLQGRHIKVDLMMSRFSPRVQATVDSITLLVGLGICVIITWQSFRQSMWQLQHQYVASVLLPVPTFPFYWLYVLGCAMLCLVLVTLLIQKVEGVVKG